MTKLLLVLGNRVCREALAQALGRPDRFAVVGCAGNALEALQQLHEVEPDLVLLGLAGSEGRALLRILLLAQPEPAVVALGLANRAEEILAWAEAGAAGFVPEDASLDDL